MNLSDWLHDHVGAEADDGLCVCIATDGLSLDSEVLGVGMMSGSTRILSTGTLKNI